MTEDIPVREDTMLYREPTPDSEDVSEIWGKRVETRVVDATEVPGMLREGWFTSPHLLDAPKREQDGGFEPVRDAAEADALRAELEAATKALGGAADAITSLKSDLTAAEDLVATESKAKDAALVRVAELEAAAAKPKLGIKAGDKPA